jgi:ATP-dependent RNA helicase RhlE
MNFESLGLSEPLLRAVRAEGYHTATPIQIQAIPTLLEGHDLMGCAQTGTGKTAAFALPTLQRLSASNKPSPESQPRDAQPSDPHSRETRNGHRLQVRRKIRTLVLSPTRELAAQIGESFGAYGKFTGLRHTVVYGGVGQGPQVRALRDGIDILVATPGRLLDLMQQGFVKLDAVEILILDEADQMLDMGFIQPLRQIVSKVPRRRQTLMFSATMPDEIRRLSAEWLQNPQHVQVAPVATTVEKVQQSVFLVEVKHKPSLLTHFLQNTPNTRTLVFARTKHGADKIVKHLTRAGIYAAAIHGNKSQSVRQRVLQQFKSKRPPVLVATDIAARGLDIDDVSHVINYDLPEVPEIYVHRIGRTARAGAAGIAISFCGREERSKLRGIERLTRRTITVEQQPNFPHNDQPRPNSQPRANTPSQSPSRPSQPSPSDSAGAPSRPQPAHAKPRSNQAGRSKSRRFPQNGQHNAPTTPAGYAQKRRRRRDTARI